MSAKFTLNCTVYISSFVNISLKNRTERCAFSVHDDKYFQISDYHNLFQLRVHTAADGVSFLFQVLVVIYSVKLNTSVLIDMNIIAQQFRVIVSLPFKTFTIVGEHNSLRREIESSKTIHL